MWQSSVECCYGRDRSEPWSETRRLSRFVAKGSSKLCLRDLPLFLCGLDCLQLRNLVRAILMLDVVVVSFSSNLLHPPFTHRHVPPILPPTNNLHLVGYLQLSSFPSPLRSATLFIGPSVFIRKSTSASSRTHHIANPCLPASTSPASSCLFVFTYARTPTFTLTLAMSPMNSTTFFLAKSCTYMTI